MFLVSPKQRNKKVYTYLFNSFCLHQGKFSVLICYIQGKFHVGVTAKEDVKFNGNSTAKYNFNVSLSFNWITVTAQYF